MRENILNRFTLHVINLDDVNKSTLYIFKIYFHLVYSCNFSFDYVCRKAKQMASFIWIASVKDAKYSLQQLIYNICSMYEKYTFFHFLPLLISYMDISMENRVATVKSRSQTFIVALIKCANSFRRKMINSLRSFYDIFIICIFLVVSSFFSRYSSFRF